MLAAVGFVFIVLGADVAAIGLTGANAASVTSGKLTAQLIEVQVVVYVPIMIYALVVVPLLARRSVSQLGLRIPTLHDLGYGAVGALAMFLIVTGVGLAQSALLHEDHEQLAVRMFADAKAGPVLWAFIGLTVVLAPFVEEFVFRAFVFNAILRWAAFPVAAVASGIIFAASHWDLYSLLPLTCAGAVLAAIYYRTGSLGASMSAHGLFNGIGLIGVALTHGAKH
jgi:membrane protease YdiL (CAAX protease family)